MQKTLITRIFGGLGNQLFVYAASRALSLSNNLKLLIDDTSGFINDPYKRKYELDKFNIKAETANSFFKFDFPGGVILQKVFRKFIHVFPRCNYITEKNTTKYDSTVFDLKYSKVNWIEGYWQSPQYFEQYREILIKDLQITAPVSSISHTIAETIKTSNAICIHARRLRNILVGEENATIKSLNIEYYEQAIKRMVALVEHPYFFCFSDDPAWFKANLKLDFPHIVIEHTTEDTAIEDLWLMTQCKHFIISNSTFPWWGAWLSEYEDKIVIAPNATHWDNKDIIPSEWVTI